MEMSNVLMLCLISYWILFRSASCSLAVLFKSKILVQTLYVV